MSGGRLVVTFSYCLIPWNLKKFHYYSISWPSTDFLKFCCCCCCYCCSDSVVIILHMIGFTSVFIDQMLEKKYKRTIPTWPRGAIQKIGEFRVWFWFKQWENSAFSFNWGLKVICCKINTHFSIGFQIWHCSTLSVLRKFWAEEK